MNSSEIRDTFLGFFESKGHTIVPSSPLIPWNDPSLLFVNAGMVQFKKVFLGEEMSASSRAVSCQKCMRAGGKHSDLENVGHTARHHTFFEMLGNFSFGDYFKREAIIYAWELLTEVFKLPKERLYASVYEQDDEAAGLWSSLVGLPDARIVRLGAKDNFWQMGDTGPCGPCSEIIIDQGSQIGCGKPECTAGCDCDRYLELWNLVFMQFNRDEKGSLTSLPKPSIDTGMGLERISAVLQEKTSNFDTDLFMPIISDISSLAHVSYGSSHESDTSLRVIADHIRATVFLLSEGLVPSNEGRGYVLRRVIRRASRHARLLNMHEPNLYRLAGSVIQVMGDVYPVIVSEQKRTEKLLKIEEENFLRTIETGMNILDEVISSVRKNGQKIIPGEEIFKLYDTYGFPIDFARDIAMDAGLSIDENAFNKEMNLQRERSKVPALKPSDSLHTLIADSPRLSLKLKTEFVGYETLQANTCIKEILSGGKSVESLEKGDEGEIILDKTPFYGESGGQSGDTGIIKSAGSLINVITTRKPATDFFLHHVKVEKGSIKKGEEVVCRVDEETRKAVMRNHTATHLLHKALRMVLGEHVKQAGSVVDAQRLRFDFTHFTSVTDDEIRKIEDIVNDKILDDLPVQTQIMTVSDAVNSGAVALFDEKYGDTVRVISAGDFSRELCGGTHCRSTGEIGLFVILSEGSVASGIRRIEALTGKNALDYLREKRREIEEIRDLLKTDNPVERIVKIAGDAKSLEKELQKLRTGTAKDTISDALKQAVELDGLRIVNIRQDGLNPNELRLLADNVRDRLKTGIIVIVSVTDNQAAILCMVTKDISNTYHAGNIVRSLSALAGGRGGGKPDMAQGGTKDIEKLDKALESLPDIVKSSKAAQNS